MLVIVLVVIVVLFVVCTTPAAFLSLFITDERKNQLGFAIFRACANNLELLGFASNFIVYCLCSSEIRLAFIDFVHNNMLVEWIKRRWAPWTLFKAEEEDIEEHEMQIIFNAK